MKGSHYEAMYSTSRYVDRHQTSVLISWWCAHLGGPLTFEQNAGAADEGFLLFLLCVRTGCPPDFQIFVHKVNITDATVGHS
jgi:hypothetical protein